MDPARPGTSGYMRTDILGYEDLHPTEGYQFLPRCVRESPNTLLSSQYPLNKAINDAVHPVTVLEPAPNPVPDPVLPRTKTHRAKLIFDTMVATRAQQLDYNQQKQMHDSTVRIAEQEVEQQQIALAQRAAARDLATRQLKKLELRDAYRSQFSERAREIDRELALDSAHELSLREYEFEQDRKEAEKQAHRREITAARHAEFRRQNDDIVARKAARKDREIADDAQTQHERSEYDAALDARAAEEVRRRDEKTRMRERVGEARARELARERENARANEEVAHSVAEQAALERVQAMKERYAQMEAERHRDWVVVQKEREARKKIGRAKVFPARREGVDAQAFEARQRKIESGRLQDYLRMQAEEKRRREEREKLEDIDADNEMLLTRQRKFEQQMRKLQGLVPESSGISVPSYVPSRSITKFF